MPVPVRCSCGATYTLKDECAGQTLACLECGAPILVGRPVQPAAPAAEPAQVSADPIFARNKFLLNQKIAINEKYCVHDEQGEPLVFVERPAYIGRRLLALASGMAAAMLWALLMGALVELLGKSGFLGGLLGLLTVVGFIPAALAGYLLVEPKRHVSFYRDETQSEKLLEVLQDKKWQFLEATYTIRDREGHTLALLRKNNLFDILRKRWYCTDPAGRGLCIIKEDSIILSLLRRLLGPLFGLLRTNFVFMRGERVIGELNRKLTFLDRYVLDLSADPGCTLDRRVALAAGVMLDTGERR